jgi:hypothetical protein
VGKIAEENLKNMEGFSENASTKLQRLAGSWENVKVAIGDAANGTGLLAGAIDGLTASLNTMSNRDLMFLEKLQAFTGGIGGLSNAAVEAAVRNQKKINEEQKKQEQIIREVDRAFKEFNGDIDAYGKAITTHIYRADLLAEFTKRLTQSEDDRVTTLAELREAEKELNDLFAQTDITDKAKLKNTSVQILAIRAQIKAIEDLLKVEKEKKPKELKMVFTPDLVAEGSLNPELRNDQERNRLKEFSAGLLEVGTSAEFAGGAVIKLDEGIGELNTKMSDAINIGPDIANAIGNLSAAFGAASSGAENFGEAILDSLSGFMKQFGASLIALGIGKVALEAFSGPAMIAAGIALSAAAGALQSISGGRSSGAGSGPGHTPSEINVTGRTFVRGYQIEQVLSEDSYRRSRTG